MYQEVPGNGQDLEQVKETRVLLGPPALVRDGVGARALDCQELQVKLDRRVSRDARLQALLPKRHLRIPRGQEPEISA